MTLEQTIAGVLGISADQITDALTVDDVQSWDSLAHVALTIGLEAAYKVSFSPSDIQRMYTSVGTIRSVLREKGVAV